jgi:tRNA pseudouridine38-40 synthase
MTKYKAIIAYDGTDFNGFQSQPGDHTRTVQEELEKTLQRLNRNTPVKVHGSGRTDSGVHAHGQVVHFELPETRDEEKLRFGLDTQTPDDIAILAIKVMHDDFHSRYDDHEKHYTYYVDNSKVRSPFRRRYAAFFRYDLDLDAIREALKLLEGEHDFTGFTATGTSVEDKVRTIYQASLEVQADNQLKFTFKGNGFLYKQIRNMMGTLLKIGNGKMPVEQITRILDSGDRQLAGPTAPPEGLYLEEVTYLD